MNTSTMPATAHAVRKPARSRKDLPTQGIDVESLPDRYAMRLKGHCLDPELMDGAFIEFSKSEAPKVGDFVILFRRPEFVAEGQTQCLIKRLATMIPPYVTWPWKEHPESEVRALVFVEQLNPPRIYQVRCSDLLAIHKCVGTLAPDEVRWP